MVEPRGHDELIRRDDDSGDARFCGLYFEEEVRRLALKRFGGDQLYQKGLRIYTTLDPELQRTAEDAVAERIRALEATQGISATRSPRTIGSRSRRAGSRDGYVLALVGGRDFHESRFNRVTQARRQPGSAFKPLLAAALERGYSPGTVVDNLTDQIAA